MKSKQSIKISLLLLITLFAVSTTSVFAGKKIIMINSVTGNVFASQNGQMWKLTPGAQLEDFIELVTEEGAQVSYSDYYDHKFHLSGSGHIKIMNRITELKRGYIWVQSYQDNEQFSVHTANAFTNFVKGEAIISFNNATGRSQILVVNGEFEFGNLLEDQLSLKLKTSEFSFIDNEYEKGLPRHATQIGYDSFKKVVSLFSGVKPMSEYGSPLPVDQLDQPKKMAEKPVREIASVEQKVQHPNYAKSDSKIGKIIILRKKEITRVPASAVPLEEMYKEKIQKIQADKLRRNPRVYDKRSGIKIKVHGISSNSGQLQIRPAKKVVAKKVQEQNKSRMPASIEPSMTVTTGPDLFEDSLVDQYKNQMRHEDEVNKLIDELKSYKQNYDKEY